MIRVRILHPTVARFALQPGDEFLLQNMTPELQSFLAARRVDGERVADIIPEDEVAVLEEPAETATVRRGRQTRRGFEDR